MFYTPGKGIHPVLKPFEVLAKLAEVLGQIKRCAPQGIADAKEIMNFSLRAPRADVIERAAQSFAAIMRSDDGLEGVAAFNEKRKARWAE